MKVTSKITINKIKIKQLNQAAITALEQTAEALHTAIVQAQVMPRDTGTLQGEETFSAGQTKTETYIDGETVTNTITKFNNGKVSIITTAPQVRRLYYHPEYNFQKTENPNARGKWFEPWLEGGEHADFCKKAFERLLKRLNK